MKNNIVHSYVNILFSKLKQVDDKDGTSAIEEFYNENSDIKEIVTLEEYTEELKEEVLIASEERYIDTDSPVLSEIDLFDCHDRATYGILLDALVKSGQIEKNFDLDAGEFKYKLK